jgi:hypothetical protein
VIAIGATETEKETRGRDRERVMMTGTGDLVKFVLSYFVSNNVLHEYFVVSIYLFWLISRWGGWRFVRGI